LVRVWPYSQILDLAGKACQGQMLKLTWPHRQRQRKKSLMPLTTEGRFAQHRIRCRPQHSELGGWSQTLDPGQRPPQLPAQLVQRWEAGSFLRLLELSHRSNAGELEAHLHVQFCCLLPCLGF